MTTTALNETSPPDRKSERLQDAATERVLNLPHPQNEIKTPRLDDVTRICIERFISEIESAEFHSRRFNIILPELLTEALRIERESRP